jgi:hypothetical protein
MTSASLPQVVCRRDHVLILLFVLLRIEVSTDYMSNIAVGAPGFISVFLCPVSFVANVVSIFSLSNFYFPIGFL